MRPNAVQVVLALVAALATAAPAHSRAALRVGQPEPVADLVTTLAEPESEPHFLLPVGDLLYFAASDPVRGETLWRSDGTAEGTAPVTDLCPGPCDATVLDPTAVGNRLFFVASEEPVSYRSGGRTETLWTSDGTAEGTVPLYRGTFRGDSGYPHALTPFDGRLYFAVPDAEGTRRLWTSDGTREGTRRLDLCPASCEPVAAVGGRLLLLVAPGNGVVELWATDGTPDGTRRLAEDASARPRDLEVIGNRAFFDGFDAEHGNEPWVTDGTQEGTFLLRDLAPGPESGGLRHAVELAGTVYLFASGPAEAPRIWRTDGTPEGTVPAEEILGAGRGLLLLGVSPVVSERFLYLSTAVPEGSPEILWRFDGVTRQVVEVAQVRPVVQEGLFGAPLGAELVFVSDQGPGRGEPWITDGTPGGTRILRNVAVGEVGSQARDLTPFGGRVVFTAEPFLEQRDLWITDGTSEGTVLLSDVAPPEASSFPRGLTAHGDHLYLATGNPLFAGNGALYRVPAGGGGAELVSTEGAVPDSLESAAGALYLALGRSGRPAALHTVPPGPVSLGQIDGSRLFTEGPGGRVFFGTFGSGEELWSTDGTPQGTRLVVDVDPRWIDRCSDTACPPPLEDEPVYPEELGAAGKALFFLAVAPEDHGAASLWTSDGTAEGTVRVSPEHALPVWEAAVLPEGALFIVRNDGSPPAPRALWWSDGTAAGTRQIFAFGPDRTPERLTVAGEAAWFLVREEGRPLALWRTDGTADGTAAVASLGGARVLVDVDDLAVVGERLFLSVHDPELGDEPWVSDGTAQGTGPVVDLWPGPRGSNPAELTALGDYLLFAADDGETGHEPWITDGTAEGTFLVADLHPGPAPSSPAGFSAFAGRVYFSADDGRIGREPWSFAAGLDGGEVPPAPEDATAIATPELAGFRLWVRITADGGLQPVRREERCIPETVCISGAVPGRSELFVRIVGPKPNGNLWPTLVRFSTSEIEVWIEQRSTGILRHYLLEGAVPGSSELDGLFDRDGFPPG